MPIRGALIGAIVRDGRAVFPRSDEVLQAGDRVIVFTETSRVAGRRARPVTAERRRTAAAIARRWAIDLAGALALDGDDDHVPQRHGARACVASRSATASRSGRSSSPVAIAGGRGLGADAARAALARPDRLPRGLPRRRRSRGSSPRSSRALPYLFAGEPQLVTAASTRSSRAMSGFSTTGATVVADVESLDRSLLLWRQLSQWLGGMGIIVLALAVLPRLRIGGRQMFESELPGPEVDQLAERIRDTARRLWLLYIALTLVLIAILLLIGLSASTTAWARSRRSRHALTTMPLGGFSTEARSLELFAPGHAVGRRAVHGDRRAQLRAPLPRARPPATRGAVPRRGGAALRRAAPRRLARSSSSSCSTPTCSPARRRCDRRLPDDVAHDRHRLRDHGLRRLADAQRDGDDRADVRRRLGGLADRAR